MIYLLVGVLVIGFVAWKFVRAGSPRGFAAGVARAQLRSLRILQAQYPGTPRDELFVTVIATRPGYDRAAAERLVVDAKGVDAEFGGPLRFSTVVLQLVAYEFLSRTGNSPMPVMDQLRAAVASVIPADL